MEAASNSVVIPPNEEVNIEKEVIKTPEVVSQDSSEHTNGVDVSMTPHEDVSEVVTSKIPDVPNDVDSSQILKEETAAESKNSSDSSITLEVSETSEATEIHVEQTPGDNLQVKTEVYIEKEEVVTIINYDNDDTNKILSQLDGHNMDINDTLDSSNNCENNNGISKQQEVLNNEELLDILEGNDESSPKHINDDKFIEHAQSLETALAIQQCQELTQRKRRTKKEEVVKVKKSKKKSKIVDTSVEEQEDAGKNIINVLVKDWDDDENEGTKEKNKDKPVKSKSMKGDNAAENQKEEKENAERNSTEVGPDTTNNQVTDTPSIDQLDESKSSDETPHKRASRVIKKKVIFDPDNPDTFTKTKNIAKVKESQSETDESVQKKKVEITSPSPAKSPTNKTLWKKPHTKNKNNFKRLTEVDKLLMDEGAVNMIYQLTPEATKGKKNTRTKAELIKKINQNTPETKEMKFRERRTHKTEESEAKKILSHKDRLSINSSVKSPSVYEDFEAHSADDSIIYRRHSSSSYSSTCMSPRRLSDVETAANQSSRLNQASTDEKEKSETSNMDTSDTFLSGEVIPDTAEIIDKKVCLNLKEKLNSKLSNALNMKRKRDSKVDKPAKLKKTTKATAPNVEKVDGAKYDVLSVCIDNNLAEIIIDNAGSPNSFYNIETLNDLQSALTFINSRNDVSVTLVTANSGRLFGRLDMQPLLVDDSKSRKHTAFQLADAIRSLLQCLHDHNKVLIIGVDGICEGLAMSMIALCDIGVASDTSTFTISMDKTKPLICGTSLLTSYRCGLPQSVVQDMMLLGRQLSTAEAAQFGLLSRTLWSRRFHTELRSMAVDISEESVQMLLLKKQMLRLSEMNTESTFLKCIEAERDLIVEHWCSATGQDLIRNVTGSA